MLHIIPRDLHDLNLHLVIAVLLQRNRVSFRNAEKLCRLLIDGRTAVREGKRLAGFPVRHADEIRHLLQRRRHNQADGDDLIVIQHIRRFFADKRSAGYAVLIFHAVNKRRSLLIGGIAVNRHLRLIFMDHRILLIHNLGNGVAETEPDKQKAHASADADNRHVKTFLIAHQIAHCRLARKVKPRPDRRNPLQHNAPSVLRRLRPHQLCRHRPHLHIAGRQRRNARAADRTEQRKEKLRPDNRGQTQGQARIYLAVRLHDHRRQEFLAEKYADSAAADRRQHGISQIARRNRTIVIAQRLHDADLPALLIHHTGHGRQGNQRRHQEKHDRQDLSELHHPLRVLPVAFTGFDLRPVKHIPFALADIFQIVPRAVDFRLRIIQLRRAVIQFALLRIQLALRIGNLLLLRGKRGGLSAIGSLRRLQLCFLCIQLRLRIIQRLLAVCDLLPPAVDLILGTVYRIKRILIYTVIAPLRIRLAQRLQPVLHRIHQGIILIPVAAQRLRAADRQIDLRPDIRGKHIRHRHYKGIHGAVSDRAVPAFLISVIRQASHTGDGEFRPA